MKNIEAISYCSNLYLTVCILSPRFSNISLTVYSVAHCLYIPTMNTSGRYRNKEWKAILYPGIRKRRHSPAEEWRRYISKPIHINSSLIGFPFWQQCLVNINSRMLLSASSSSPLSLSFIATAAFHRNDPIRSGKYFRNSVERLFDKAHLVYAS